MSEENLQKLQTTTAKRSLHLEHSLAKEVKNRIGKNAYYQQVDVNPAQLNTMGRSLERIARDFQKKKDNNDLGILVLQGNNLLIKGLIAAGFALAPATGGVSLVVSAAGYVASKGLDAVENMAKEAMREGLRKNLKTQLEEYRTKRGQQEFDNLLAKPDVTSFIQDLETRVGTSFGNALDNIPPEDQDIVNAFRTKELAGIMTDGFSFLANTEALQSEQIEQNNKNIVGLARTFKQFAEQNQKQLESLIESQTEIKTGIENLNNRVDQTHQSVEFIQEFMFGKMTPAEQRNALERGIFPDMPEDQRKDLEEKIKLTEKREEFNQTVNSYLDGAAQVLNIAKNFGVEADLVNKVENAVNMGTQAFNAVAAFSSGNYLAGVSAISNICGFGGQRDIAGERHEQILNMLGDIYEEIGVIHQKLDWLKEGQERIMKAQQQLFDAVITLSEQVMTNHREVIEKLQEIQGDILYNRRLIADTILEDYPLCDALVIDMNTGKEIINTGENLYPNHNDFVDLYNDFKNEYQICVTRQRKTRGINGNFHTIFHLETYKDEVNKVEDYITKIYNPALNFLTNTNEISPKTFDERVSSLMSPMVDVKGLETKIPEIIYADQRRFQRSFQILMDSLIAPSIVKMHTDYILNYHFYYQLIDSSTNNPFTLNELLDLQDINRLSLRALYESLSLVDISIAQQCLIGGDFLLFLMSEVFKRQSNTPTEDDNGLFLEAKTLIKYNSLLARNFIVYILRKEILANSSALNYSIALSINNDSSLLKEITDFAWDFQWSENNIMSDNQILQPKGWSAKIDDSYISLPQADELSMGKFIYPPDLYMLMSLRTRLLDEISSYNIFDGMSDNKRLIFNEMVLNSI